MADFNIKVGNSFDIEGLYEINTGTDDAPVWEAVPLDSIQIDCDLKDSANSLLASLTVTKQQTVGMYKLSLNPAQTAVLKPTKMAVLDVRMSTNDGASVFNTDRFTVEIEGVVTVRGAV
jgi:hypothetical protein